MSNPFRPPEEAKKRRKRKKKLEKHTERSASKKMREDGAKIVKLNIMGQKSWPDRLIFSPGARMRIFVCVTETDAMEIYNYMSRQKKPEPFMIEYKREGEDLTELQAQLHQDIGK